MKTENTIIFNTTTSFEKSGETLDLTIKLNNVSPESKEAVREMLKTMLDEIIRFFSP